MHSECIQYYINVCFTTKFHWHLQYCCNAVRLSYKHTNLWTERHQGCTDSNAEQKPPSFDRSSELHPVTWNSTRTACMQHGERFINEKSTKWDNNDFMRPSKKIINSGSACGHLRAWTRLRSVNSWSSTKAWRTWILNSSLKSQSNQRNKTTHNTIKT